jgi:hypothetical protein
MVMVYWLDAASCIKTRLVGCCFLYQNKIGWMLLLVSNQDWLDAVSCIKTSRLSAPQFGGFQNFPPPKATFIIIPPSLIPLSLKEFAFKSVCFYYLLINSSPFVYDQIKNT